MQRVAVAIPVLNGERYLEEVLTAVRRQSVDAELLVADSGSTDRSREISLSYGARLLEIPEFSHGGTRNVLMREADAELVAFLTQDARPVDEHWLRRLLEGFERARDVALVFGPYVPRPEASHMVRRELEEFFGAMAPDGAGRIDRLGDRPAPLSPSALTFFTDANGCVSK